MSVAARHCFHPFLIGVLVAVGLPGAEVCGQTESEVVKQVRMAFRSRLETASSVEVKRSALAAAAEFDSPKIAKALIQAYRVLEREAGPLETRRQELLQRGGGSRVLSPLRGRVQPIHNLQRRLIRVLDGLKAPASVSELVAAFIKPKRRHPFALRLALSKRAGELANEDLNLVTKVRRKRSAEDRVLLCKALASLGKRASGSLDWVIEQMDHESIDVRIEAIRTLEFLAAPRSLAPLIDRLDAERGRIRDQVLATLQTLTGANPGPASQSWRLWLADVGQAFVRGEKPLGGKRPKVRRAPVEKVEGKRKGKGKPEAKGTGSYFGIPQDGNSILYVFDNSNSMKRNMGRGASLTRMDRCRAELHKGLKGLTPNKTFNLLCFANKLRRFSPGMLSATSQNLQRAHKWVDGIGLELETNTYDSLEHAFQIAGRGSVDRQYPVVADTIFFLSDGAPTIKGFGLKGKGRGLGRDSVVEILAAVRRWNPLRRVVIHAIGLGVRQGKRAAKNNPGRGDGPREFLEKLAAQNGGQFVNPK